MKIYDEKYNLIENPDLSLGYLKEEKRLVESHPAIEAVEEVGHYETIREYPNGGKDVEWVIDIPGTPAVDAWDEYEDIQRYIPYTKEELANKKEEEEAEKRKPLTVQEKLELFMQAIPEDPYPYEISSLGDEYIRMYSPEKNKFIWAKV